MANMSYITCRDYSWHTVYIYQLTARRDKTAGMKYTIYSYTANIEYHSPISRCFLFSCAKRLEGHCTLMTYCSYNPTPPYLQMQHHINLDNFNILYTHTYTHTQTYICVCVCVFKIQGSQHISQYSWIIYLAISFYGNIAWGCGIKNGSHS